MSPDPLTHGLSLARLATNPATQDPDDGRRWRAGTSRDTSGPCARLREATIPRCDPRSLSYRYWNGILFSFDWGVSRSLCILVRITAEALGAPCLPFSIQQYRYFGPILPSLHRTPPWQRRTALHLTIAATNVVPSTYTCPLPPANRT